MITALLAADLLRSQTGWPALAPSARFSHDEIGEIPVFKAGASEGSAFLFASQMQVNTDVAPDAYQPDDTAQRTSATLSPWHHRASPARRPCGSRIVWRTTARPGRRILQENQRPASSP